MASGKASKGWVERSDQKRLDKVKEYVLREAETAEMIRANCARGAVQ